VHLSYLLHTKRQERTIKAQQFHLAVQRQSSSPLRVCVVLEYLYLITQS
jgi:hypothetical protein